MSDKMGDLLAEQLGGEVVQEQPKELQTEVVDLTGGSEPQTESTTESITELNTESADYSNKESDFK